MSGGPYRGTERHARAERRSITGVMAG